MNAPKKILKAIIPHGLVEMRHKTLSARMQKADQDSRLTYHAERRKRIAAVQNGHSEAWLTGDDFEKVIAFLVSRGLPENQVREGSVPKKSLEFIKAHVISEFEDGRPLRALHIGNFVGVSLAYAAASLVKKHPESLVISIDPNLTHRGIPNPQSHVSALLAACGLTTNVLIIAGYSGRKSISNDGVVFEGYDPAKEFTKEFACEGTLNKIEQLCPASFDFVFLDGNHEATYLINEIKQALPVLRENGFLILDDVDAAWVEIRNIFLNVSSLGLEPVGTDGRVGIARLNP
jgi:hypothetical protein